MAYLPLGSTHGHGHVGRMAGTGTSLSVDCLGITEPTTNPHLLEAVSHRLAERKEARAQRLEEKKEKVKLNERPHRAGAGAIVSYPLLAAEKGERLDEELEVGLNEAPDVILEEDGVWQAQKKAHMYTPTVKTKGLV